MSIEYDKVTTAPTTTSTPAPTAPTTTTSTPAPTAPSSTSTQSSNVRGTPGASWSEEEILTVKAKILKTFIHKGRRGLSRKALISTGLPDESKDGKLYHFGTFHQATKLLRLAFHDCLKYKDGTGGCDGCLNWKGVGMYFEDKGGQQLYDDVSVGDNNGLRPTVEVLEAIYTDPKFPANSPVLSKSLKDSGKSRADLWSLAAIVAVEWGIDTNNMKCEDPASRPGGCHHLQGEPGCLVRLNRTIPFRTGRSDCISDHPDRPYIATKEEVHADAMGDGRQTLDFFQDNFGFNGQETVAIMGAHTFGRLNVHNSLFRYVWTARGTKFFNNDYYKMITDETRWYFNDLKCTKVGDPYHNKGVRRWTTHFRSDTANRGPVHWISESYVCPNCAKEKNAEENRCCQNVPEGLFCTPDAQNMTEKTPNQLNAHWEYCETFKFISGIDEMALTCEMGLYFDFQNNNSFPTGCPGFEQFDGNHGSWSSIDGMKTDPQCPLQSLARPESDHSTSWYMKEYAVNQDRWLRDFVNVFDKMMSNGYDKLGEEKVREIQCSRDRKVSQCWVPGELEDGEWLLVSELDKRVVVGSCGNTKPVVETREDSNVLQRWRVSRSKESFQLVNVGSGKLLNIDGISDFIWGLDVNAEGFSTLRANGGLQGDLIEGGHLAADRGWTEEDGTEVAAWKEHGAPNQRFKLELLSGNTATTTSPCN